MAIKYEDAAIIWPTQSPLADLHSIENIWWIIKLQIAQQCYRIESIKELSEIIQEEWNNLDMRAI
jgi:hypothetical protein